MMAPYYIKGYLTRPALLGRFGVSIVVLFFSSMLKAQSDTYFALPPLYEWQGGQHTIDLQFSASSSTSNVWIYNSDTSYSQNLVVTPGALVTTSLTNVIGGLSSTYGARELTWSNSKRYKDALFIEASQPVTVTERVKHQFNQDTITGKGTNGIGTDFYVASQTLILST